MGNIILKAAAETTMIPFTALAALPDITCYFNCFPASITTEKSIATIVVFLGHYCLSTLATKDEMTGVWLWPSWRGGCSQLNRIQQ